MPEVKTNLDNKNEQRIGYDVTMVSGTTLTVSNFIPGSIGPGIMPFEYYVYKVSGLVQVRNNSGVIQYSGADAGAVINSMLSGANDHISIGFQPNDYSGQTTVLNAGVRHVMWYGNGAQIGMKIKIKASGTPLAAANNVFDSFTFSGTGAGLIFDSTLNCAVQNSRFFGCAEGISFESSEFWSEIWRLNNLSFNNCYKSIVFKTPTGSGTGSYVNGLMDQATFNSEATFSAPYTFLEVQDDAEISESKIIDTRWWFNAGSGIGIHMQSGSLGARTMWFKPLFENFNGGNSNIAIKIDPTAPAMYWVGRPTFAGTSFNPNMTNSGNVHSLGSVSTWRQTATLTIPAGADTFSTSATVVSTSSDDFDGVPNVYIILGGTFAAAETVTIELTANAIHSGGTGASFAITKTYKFTGTYPLELTDYQSLTSAGYRYIISSITGRIKSSAASSTVTCTVVSLAGGTAFQPNPVLSGLTWLGVTNSGQGITNGTATALTTPRGYIRVTISGQNMNIPYFS